MIVHINNNMTEAFLLQQEGNYLDAIQHAHAKLLKGKMNDDVRAMLDAYVDLYYCYFNELLFEEALHVYEAHKALFASTNHPQDLMYHYLMSYMLYDMTKQYDAGIDILQKAIAIATSLRIHHIVGLANCFIGALYTRKKQHTEAIHYATLGVAYIRTFAPHLPFYHMQCEVCLAQIFISARALDDAAPLIESIRMQKQLPQHQTIYVQFLFIQLRYFYCTNQLEQARAFRDDTLLQTIESTSDYVIAKLLLPTIKHTLTELHIQEELHFWLAYEQTLQSVITDEITSMLRTFSSQQQTLLLQEYTMHPLLPKSDFFDRGQAMFESTTKPLLLLLCQIHPSEQLPLKRSYFQFHVMQQAIDQLVVNFPRNAYIGSHLTQNKFALLFQYDDVDYIIAKLQHLPKSVHIDLFDKTYESPLYFSYTTTWTSRSNSFLEMYHLLESRLYQLVFR